MLDVYKSCYKLKAEPFRLSPDHRFSFVHPSYANARAYLEYAISQGEGFIAITGEPGTGKTTLINGLLDELDRTHVLVATLRNIHLDSDNLVKMVADAFDLRLHEKTKAACLLELEQFLKAQIHKGRRSAVLIVDEAQGLGTGSLEELRLLSNLQYDNRLLLQIFLVGQEEVMDIIHAPGMEHLLQRLIAASHLERLELDETVAYIEHRLCHAGWRGDPAISEHALRLIHAFSEGVPRRINLICQRLFLYGGIKKKHRLEGEDAQYVIGELQRERILAPDSSVGDIAAATADEISSGGSGPDFGLPRAGSFFPFEQCEEPPDQGKSSTPLDEEVSEERETQTGTGNSGYTEELVPAVEDSDPELAESFSPQQYSAAEEAEAQAGTPVTGKGRRRALMALLALLVAGSMLVSPMATDLRGHLAGLFSGTSDQTGGGVNSALRDSDNARKLSPVSQIERVTSTPEQLPVAQTGTAGSIQRIQQSSDLVVDPFVSQAPEPEAEESASSGMLIKETLQDNPVTQPSFEDESFSESQESRYILKEQLVSDPQAEVTAVFAPDEAVTVTEQDTRLERLRLRKEAQRRFTERLAHDMETGKSTVLPALPVLRVGTTPVQIAKISSSGKDSVKSSLLEGLWVSKDQPAALLPSRTTSCKADKNRINCWSIPKNVDTKLGVALYKVEATIQNFSSGNAFQLSYQTLVKLVDSKDSGDAEPDDRGWQVTEHVMQCRLVQLDWVKCKGAKGIMRDYRRLEPDDNLGVDNQLGGGRLKTLV